MRTLLLYIAFLMPLFVFSQGVRLDRVGTPAYVIANQIDTLGILFSVDEVQKIDHDLEVLEYLERLSKEVDTTQFHYINLIGELEEKTQLQKYRIINLTSENFKQGELILKLKEDNRLTEKLNVNKDIEIDNQQKIIEEKDDEIRKQKTIKVIAIIAGALTILALLAG